MAFMLMVKGPRTVLQKRRKDRRKRYLWRGVGHKQCSGVAGRRR